MWLDPREDWITLGVGAMKFVGFECPLHTTPPIVSRSGSGWAVMCRRKWNEELVVWTLDSGFVGIFCFRSGLTKKRRWLDVCRRWSSTMAQGQWFRGAKPSTIFCRLVGFRKKRQPHTLRNLAVYSYSDLYSHSLCSEMASRRFC